VISKSGDLVGFVDTGENKIDFDNEKLNTKMTQPEDDLFEAEPSLEGEGNIIK
jgi:hypothetical protein